MSDQYAMTKESYSKNECFGEVHKISNYCRMRAYNLKANGKKKLHG